MKTHRYCGLRTRSRCDRAVGGWRGAI
jgi:hypothetical protein